MSQVITVAAARRQQFDIWVESVVSSQMTIRYTIPALFKSFGKGLYINTKSMASDWKCRISLDNRVKQVGIPADGYYICAADLNLKLPPIKVVVSKSDQVKKKSLQCLLYDLVEQTVLASGKNMMMADIEKTSPISINEAANFATYVRREFENRKQSGYQTLDIQTIPHVGTVVAPKDQLVTVSVKRQINQAAKIAKGETVQSGRQKGAKYIAHDGKRYIGLPISPDVKLEGFERLTGFVPTAFCTNDVRDIYTNDAKKNQYLIELKNGNWLLFQPSK